MNVATLLGPRLEDLQDGVAALDPHADLFEVRLDTIDGAPIDPAPLRALTKKPLIATCRTRRDGGRFAGPDEERLALLRSCLDAGFEYADVEGETRLEADEARLIRSRHELRGTPPAAGMAIWCQSHAEKGALAKFASLTRGVYDEVQVLTAAHRLHAAGVRNAVMGLGGFPRALLPMFAVGLVYGGGPRRPTGQPDLAAIAATTAHWGSPPASLHRYLVLGDPISHSLSPRMHNAAFRAASVDAAYGAYTVRGESELQIVLEHGTGIGLDGASVTTPLKDAAFDLLPDRTKAADAAGAVNCVKATRDGYEGTNTDGAGAVRVLRRLLGGRSGHVLVLGTGGAARAVAAARDGLDVTLAGRRTEHVRAAERLLGVDALLLPEAASRISEFDAVVNATSVADPLSVDGFEGALFDFHYGPQPTRWEARAEGAKFAGGRDLLLEQGVLAFEYWTGREAPRRQMADALGVTV